MTARRSIFIGSSVEGLPIAEQFRSQLVAEADAIHLLRTPRRRRTSGRT